MHFFEEIQLFIYIFMSIKAAALYHKILKKYTQV
jgi:hypothetical protein